MLSDSDHECVERSTIYEDCMGSDDSERLKNALSIFTVASVVVCKQPLETATRRHGWPSAELMLSTFKKMQQTLSYFLQGLSSIKWDKSVRSAMDLVWAFEIEEKSFGPRPTACAACGRGEANIDVGIRLFGVPLGPNGYEASEWLVTADRLNSNGIDFWDHFKNQWNGLKCGIHDMGKNDDATSFLGTVFLGKTCFQWMNLALTAQTVISDVFLKSSENMFCSLHDIETVARLCKQCEEGIVYGKTNLRLDKMDISRRKYTKPAYDSFSRRCAPNRLKLQLKLQLQFDRAKRMELPWPQDDEVDENDGNKNEDDQESEDFEGYEPPPDEEGDETDDFQPKRRKRARAGIVLDEYEVAEEDSGKTGEVGGEGGDEGGNGGGDEGGDDDDQSIGSFHNSNEETRAEARPSPVAARIPLTRVPEPPRPPPPPPSYAPLRDAFIESIHYSADEETMSEIRALRNPGIPPPFRLCSRGMAVRLSASFMSWIIENGSMRDVELATLAVCVVSEFARTKQARAMPIDECRAVWHALRNTVCDMDVARAFEQADHLSALGLTFVEAVCLMRLE
jgi:hypothetical protein